MQPLEEILPYPTFALRIDRFEALGKVHASLSAVSDPRVAAMRRAGRRVRRAFSWTRGRGLAYNYTILRLCQRAIELRGRLRARGAAGCQVHAAGLPAAHPSPRPLRWLPPQLAEASDRLATERRQAVQALEAEQLAARATVTSHATAVGATPEVVRAAIAAAAAAVNSGAAADLDAVDLATTASFGFETLAPAAGCRAGFCNVTSGRGECTRASMGSWPLDTQRGSPLRRAIRTVEDCRDACRQCARCHYISFSRSPTHHECSWYSHCDMRALHPPPISGPDYQSCTAGQTATV